MLILKLYQFYLVILKKINRLDFTLRKLDTEIMHNSQLHQHYHYFSSAIYTYLGHCYSKQKEQEQSNIYYLKARFQDHENYSNDKNYADYIDKLISEREYLALKPKNTPNKMSFLQDIGYNYLKLRQYDSALDSFNKLASNSKVLLGKSIAYYHKENYRTAIEFLLQAEKILQKEHDIYHGYSSNLHYKRAYIHYLKKDYDLCVTDLCKSLDLDSNNIEALLFRAKNYKIRKSFILAIQDYSTALKMHPKNKILINEITRLEQAMTILS